MNKQNCPRFYLLIDILMKTALIYRTEKVKKKEKHDCSYTYSTKSYGNVSITAQTFSVVEKRKSIIRCSI